MKQIKVEVGVLHEDLQRVIQGVFSVKEAADMLGCMASFVKQHINSKDKEKARISEALMGCIVKLCAGMPEGYQKEANLFLKAMGIKIDVHVESHTEHLKRCKECQEHASSSAYH